MMITRKLRGGKRTTARRRGRGDAGFSGLADQAGGYERGDLRVDADRTGEARTEVGLDNLNVHARFRRLEHPPVADVDSDMRDVVGGCRVGVVEEQIAWPNMAELEQGAGSGLVSGHARHYHAGLGHSP